MIRLAKNLRLGHSAEQIPHQAVEFAIGDQMGGLLVQKRAAEDPGQPEQCMAAACQAIGLAVGTDQLTLNTECGGLQRDKINVLKCRTIHSLAKHDCWILASLTVQSATFCVQ